MRDDVGFEFGLKAVVTFLTDYRNVMQKWIEETIWLGSRFMLRSILGFMGLVVLLPAAIVLTTIAFFIGLGVRCFSAMVGKIRPPKAKKNAKRRKLSSTYQ